MTLWVFNEVLHKLMLTEAVKTYGLSSEREALKLIKEKPELISNKYGLLISDAVHAAVMKINTIDNIASNDSDFERIEGITVWKP